MTKKKKKKGIKTRGEHTTDDTTVVHSPAYGTLAVSWPLRHAQGLSYLGLRQTQRQSAKLEHLRELLDLVQIDPIDHVVRRLVDRRLICNYS